MTGGNGEDQKSKKSITHFKVSSAHVFLQVAYATTPKKREVDKGHILRKDAKSMNTDWVEVITEPREMGQDPPFLRISANA